MLLALLLAAAAPQEAAAVTSPPAAQAAPAPVDARAEAFRAFLASIRLRALAEGVSPQTFDRVAATLTFNPRVVQLDRAQPGQNPSTRIAPFAPYRARHVDRNRIERGRRAFSRVRPHLERIERETGVPEVIAVAIWGHETDYGGYAGDFDLPRSLASLAFDGRRRELFTAEFIASLKLIDRGIARETLKGSWAGATGHPQFLPSVYLQLARDGDGDGKADIWRSEADAVASIGAYLKQAGWRTGQPWGTAATLPAGLDRAALQSRLTAPRCPRVHGRHSRWLTIAEWRALGVVPQAGWPSDEMLATLIEPDGEGETSWLLSSNYRSILEYNCSNFYALSIGLLADEVGR